MNKLITLLVVLLSMASSLHANAQDNSNLTDRQFVEDLNLANMAIHQGNVERARILLNRQPPESRNFAWRYLSDLCLREPVVLRGMKGPVESIDISPDGKLFASGGGFQTSNDFTILVNRMEQSWNAFAGELLVAELETGKMVLERSSRERVIDFVPGVLPSGVEVLPTSVAPPEDSFISCVRFGPDSRSILAVGWNILEVKDQSFGALIGGRGQDKKTTRFLTTKWWDLDFMAGNSEDLRTSGMESPRSLAISPKGDLIVLATSGRGFGQQSGKLWWWDKNLEFGKLRFSDIKRFEGNYNPTSAFSPDGKFLAVGRAGGKIEIWNVKSRSISEVVVRHNTTRPGVAWIAPKILFSAGKNRIFWGRLDATTEQLESISIPQEIAQFDVAPNGGYFAIADKNDKLWVYDCKSKQVVDTFDRHRARISRIKFSPDSTRIVSGSYDKTVRVWDFTKNNKRRADEKSNAPVLQLAITADKKIKSLRKANSFFSTNSMFRIEFSGQNISIQNAGADNKLTELKFGEKPIAHSSSGNKLAICFPKSVKIIDLKTAKQIDTIELSDRPTAIGFNSENGLLVVAFGNQVEVWNRRLSNWRKRFNWDIHDCIDCEIGDSGVYAYTRTSSGQVQTWNLNDGKNLRVYGQNHAETALISQDGRTLVTSGKDGFICLRDIPTGLVMATVPQRNVTSLFFRQDVGVLAAGTSSGDIFIWESVGE